MHSADLTGANLTGANLTGAFLVESNLTGANLTGTNLASTDLKAANLAGATGGTTSNVSGAIWYLTTCPDGTNSSTNGTSPQSCVGNGHGF